MKKVSLIVAAIAISSIAFAQSPGTGASGTDQHPAANKKADTTVPSRDGIYSNSTKDRASDELNKKQRQGRVSNGVIDQGAPGGMGQPEGKGQSNPTSPQTE
jgi:hypothetical protein